MRRQSPIAHALYKYLYPNPAPEDPPSFAAHLAKNLVPEVRVEVATFYGDLNTVEARYPGLNYCYPAHRMRLGRFKHHRRLFEAFDALGLTYQEIQDFCCWEGSRWARLKYEEDQGEKVIDTTGNGIGPWVDRRHQKSTDEHRRQSITRKTDISVVFEEAVNPTHMYRRPASITPDHEATEVVECPRLLRLFNESVERLWGQGGALPPELEAMFKEGVERGELDRGALLILAQARRAAEARARVSGIMSGLSTTGSGQPFGLSSGRPTA